jgi:hypothetical protein
MIFYLSFRNAEKAIQEQLAYFNHNNSTDENYEKAKKCIQDELNNLVAKYAEIFDD